MKLHHLLVLLPVAVVMLSAGCATKPPMVSAASYSHFTLTPTNTITLSAKANPKPQDEQLSRVLVAELDRAGFELVPPEKADYILTYVIEDEWSEERGQSTMASPMPAAQTSDQVRMGNGTQTPGISPAPVNTTFTAHSKGIRLIVFTNPKTHPGGLDIVWQGCIDTGQSLTPENETALVRILPRLFWAEPRRPRPAPALKRLDFLR